MQNLTKNNGDKAEEHFIWQWGFFQLIYAPKVFPHPPFKGPNSGGNHFQVILASTGACIQ